MLKKLLAILLILCTLLGCLSGCGKKETPAPPVSGQEETPTPPINDPLPEPKPLYQNPLNGKLEEMDYSKQRPYAIMLNNLKAALPQHSISTADMIFEMNVEGNVTRMLALFQNIDQSGERIGSIRSSRHYYLDLVEAFDAVYIHAGGSEQAYDAMSKRGITHIDGVRGSGEIFWRDQERLDRGVAFEHTMFTSAEKINAKVPKMKIRHEHEEGFEAPYLFTNNVVAANGQLLANETGKLTNFNVWMNKSKKTGFAYDAGTRLYSISEYNAPYVDGNTSLQMQTKNVIVMYLGYSNIKGDDKGRLDADMSKGEGVYICEGRAMDISWKLEKNHGVVWTAKDGSPLQLSQGNTYICCANKLSGSIEDLGK